MPKSHRAMAGHNHHRRELLRIREHCSNFVSGPPKIFELSPDAALDRAKRFVADFPNIEFYTHVLNVYKVQLDHILSDSHYGTPLKHLWKPDLRLHFDLLACFFFEGSLGLIGQEVKTGAVMPFFSYDKVQGYSLDEILENWGELDLSNLDGDLRTNKSRARAEDYTPRIDIKTIVKKLGGGSTGLNQFICELNEAVAARDRAIMTSFIILKICWDICKNGPFKNPQNASIDLTNRIHYYLRFAVPGPDSDSEIVRSMHMEELAKSETEWVQSYPPTSVWSQTRKNHLVKLASTVGDAEIFSSLALCGFRSLEDRLFYMITFSRAANILWCLDDWRLSWLRRYFESDLAKLIETQKQQT